MGVNIQYFVIYNTDDENIPLENIWAQHLTLNRDFNMKNTDIKQVPSSGNYNFASNIGNPQIAFLPFSESLSTQDLAHSVHRVETTKESLEDVDEVEILLKASGFNLQNNNLRVYICRLKDNTLGQAIVFSDAVMVDFRTVGGTECPGPASFYGYNTGRTATHEIGHVFGLPHTFLENGTCREGQASADGLTDIPIQKYPNYDAYLRLDKEGNSDGVMCNYYKDIHNISVLSTTGDITAPYSCVDMYEMFFNFMDYGDDFTAIMFSKTQASAMRTYLLETNLLDVTILGQGVSEKNEAAPVQSFEQQSLPETNNLSPVIVCSILFVFLLSFAVLLAIKYVK